MSNLKVANVLNLGGTKSVPSDTLISGSAKAWCNFDGTLSGTITPRASFNVASITKNGTGLYTVNYSVTLGTTAYAVILNAYAVTVGARIAQGPYGGLGLKTATAFPMVTIDVASSIVDTNNVDFAAYTN